MVNGVQKQVQQVRHLGWVWTKHMSVPLGPSTRVGAVLCLLSALPWPQPPQTCLKSANAGDGQPGRCLPTLDRSAQDMFMVLT